MLLEKSSERILHEKDGLVLHYLIILRGLSSLAIVACYDVQQYLLVLRDGLAVLRDEILCLVTKLLVHA